MHSGSSNSYFNNKALPLNLVNRSLYGATMIIGDALLVLFPNVFPSTRIGLMLHQTDLQSLEDL